MVVRLHSEFENCTYRVEIEELGSSLVWINLTAFPKDGNYHKSVDYRTESGRDAPFTGMLQGFEVTEEECEILTGMHMPAAMDRLRELVHETR